MPGGGASWRRGPDQPGQARPRTDEARRDGRRWEAGMALARYGVLKGRVLAGVRETAPRTPHFHIHVLAADTHFRVAVNVQARLRPVALLLRVDTAFSHEVCAHLERLPPGFTPLRRAPGGAALDYVRGDLLERHQMRALPAHRPGPTNDLTDAVESHVLRALDEPGAVVYAFGDRWGPHRERDQVFGFAPSNGIHDVHMNQGNGPPFQGDNGVWQDGALLLHFPARARWVAVFLAFQTQTWQTDDHTGRPHRRTRRGGRESGR